MCPSLLFSHIGKEKILFDFYKNLLGASGSSTLSFDLNSLFSGSTLDTHQANTLIRPFDLDEIRLAVLGMNSNASPGPDGFGPAFFKKFWDLSKLHLLSYLSDFHSR